MRTVRQLLETNSPEVFSLAPDAPVIWPEVGSNLCVLWDGGRGAEADAAFEGAHRTVQVELVQNRLVGNPMEPRVWGINDSKKLTPARRELLSVKIAEVATAIGFCHIAPKDIDEMGMARAIRTAVAGAVADTGLEPDCVLMDGNPLGAVPNERDVVKGDAKIACIAAASIMAKVTRDEMMVEYDAEYPEYHLAESKGYASPEHIEAIRKHGLCPLHRVSSCGNFLQTERLF